jgi:hypothetical protein
MFNLEQSIAEWRRQMQGVGVQNSETLEELESHLREDVARRVQSGETEERAFERAVRDIGQPSLLKHEFAKLGGKKSSWLSKLKRLIAGAPIPSLSTFSPGALRTLKLAEQEAPRLHHGFIGTEHLLLGLLALDDGPVPNLLMRLRVDREDLKQQIENWVKPFPSGKLRDKPPLTPRVEKSLKLAAAEAKVSNDTCIGTEHIFLGLLLERGGVAGRVLRNLGLSPATVRQEIAKSSA